MSEALANTISLWLLLPALAVLVLLLGAQVAGTPDGVRKRRRQRQLAELEQVRAAAGSRLEIDWLRYKELPKQELLERLGKYGWHHAGHQVGESSWLLCFSRDPANRERPDCRQRLGEELATAQPDADGSYRLDSSQYADARERNNHWAKQFNRQVLFAFLYGFTGVSILVGTALSAGDGNLYPLPVISVIVLALCGIAVTKATLIRKRRLHE
jgi:hypothetical protein